MSDGPDRSRLPMGEPPAARSAAASRDDTRGESEGGEVMMSQQESPSYDPIGAARDAAWKEMPSILQKVVEKRPNPGRHVRITSGKYAGHEAIVFWHGVDRFSSAGRWGDSFQEAMRVARGTYGYRVGVEMAGGFRIFVAADKVEVLDSSKPNATEEGK